MSMIKKICFISSFVPRECGIATYTQNLISAIKSANSKIECQVFAMNDGGRYSYPEIVKFIINEDRDEDYLKAAEILNNSDVDLVSVQHEFGIFGGYNGRKLLLFLKNLKKPSVITFHTVPIKLLTPYRIEAKRYKSRTKLLKKILPLASAVTVMTETAKKYISDNFEISSEKIYVIPHGAQKVLAEKVSKDKEKKESLGFEKDDFIISTFGLISPKKGLEYVIKALPNVIKSNPSIKIKYAILGKMHPKKPKAYLDYLIMLSEKLKIKSNVVFNSHYMTYQEIYLYLANTDIYITPYYTREQASSGTLSYAIEAGKCVVSTPYVFAQDIIANYNVGELINFKDSESIIKVINKLIKNPELVKKYSKNSKALGMKIEWPKIGLKFIEAFNQQVDK